jgi:hypothetical protein
MANTQAVMIDMRQSMNRVERARPIIAELLNGGEIIPGEGDDNEVCKLLDMTCGTDYLQAYKDKGLVWGVASRIQIVRKGMKPYNTFTVRKARESGVSTEYEKRAYAIEHGGVYPFLTMQAYVDENENFLSVGIAKTTDVMEFVEKGYARQNHTGKHQIGQAAFYVCRWDEMASKGYKVLIWQMNRT